MSRHKRVMLATLLIVSGVLVFSPYAYVVGGGMVVNQSFEQGEERVPYGWNLAGKATRVNTAPIYAGNWAARITGANDTLTQWLYLGNITLPITYNAWGWLYVSGNVTGIIGFDFWAGEEGVPLSPVTMLTATDTNGTYVQRSTTMHAPAGTTHLRIRLLGTGWNARAEVGEVRFDEIGFYPVTGFCFIATAAYGTETASQLDILRAFRDQVFLKNALGSLFVEAYYKVSPPIANFIAKNDFLRAVVREMLVEPVIYLLQWSQSLWKD